VKSLTASGCLLVGVIATAMPVQAQDVELSRLEMGIGAVWTGPTRFPRVDADETGNDGEPFSLFNSKSDLQSVVGLEGRFAVRVSRRMQLEVSGSYGRARLRTRITDDFEDIADIDISEKTIHAIAQGAIIVHFDRRVANGVPFVTVGGGYLRELHEGQTVVESGRRFFGGAGLRYARLRAGSRISQWGIRVEARAVARTGGIALDDQTHVGAELAASLFFGF
jgi:hypothetical protein